MIIWTGKMLKELRELYVKHSCSECAKIMGLPASSVKNAIGRNKIHSGRTGKFQVGHNTWDKGKKGLMIGGKETLFKKGNLPHNTKSDGFITIRSDGYQYIRIAKAQWVLYHRYLWEKEYGTIPKDKVLVFKDQNPMNCDLENLELISRKENLKRNQNRIKAGESLRRLYQRERVRKKYGLSPISGHGDRIVNY